MRVRYASRIVTRVFAGLTLNTGQTDILVRKMPPVINIKPR